MLPDPNLSPEERMRRGMRVAYGNRAWPDERAEEFERIIGWRLEYPQPPEAATSQFMAGLGFDTEVRLHQIHAPTLVISGTDDRVVPPRNAELLTESIPDAKLDIIPGAGHLVFIERAERFNHDVIAFLTGHEV